MDNKHIPDESRLPKCVTGWKRVEPGTMFSDGSKLLVAMKFNNRFDNSKWYFHFEVVTVRCDEDYFSLLNAEGDHWDYEIADVDFYVVLVP